MSLIFPDGSRTINPPMPRGRDYALPPAQPAQASPFQGQPDAELLSYLYEELKAKYPGIPDADLREAAKKLLGELRTKQADEFNQRFFPERMNQQAPPPAVTAPQPLPPQRGLVAQNEQRPWKHSPGAPGSVEFTDTPDYETRRREAVMKRVAEEQENFAKQQAAKTALKGIMPGQAQAIQPPSEGTPYQPAALGFRDENGDQVDDRLQMRLPTSVRPNTGKPGNRAPIGPSGERWAF